MKLSQIDGEDLASLSNEQVGRIVFGDDYANVPKPHSGVAALLLGGSPPVMDARAQAAAALYREGLVPLIIPTGGARHPDQGCAETEAEYLARALRGLGVPDEAIFLEREALTTRENMILGEAKIERVLHLRGEFSVYIVTSAFHLRRSLALARLYLPRTAHILGRAALQRGDSPADWPQSEYFTGRVRKELGLLKGLVDNGEMDDIEFQP